MEEPISFVSGNLRLAGMLEKEGDARAVIITHPHPLYGGDMDNPVVRAVRRAYLGKGYSTMRFNFRGTGESEGRYDNGVGEREDVQAAIAWLVGLGMTAVDLAGYSFGAWVNAGVRAGFQRMVMVSPPVAFIDFGPPVHLPRLHLIVTGDGDDIAPAGIISAFRAQWNPAAAFEVIPGADHFYSRSLEALEKTLAAHI
ncbi:MAG: alpha/beta hydrolase [Hyphomicrobiales bacterium]